MKINSGRGNIIMQQQMMAQRANKPNTSSNQAKNTGGGSDNDGDSDGGGETSRAQKSEQTGGINYKQLTAAVNTGVIRPSTAPRNREENSGNGGVSARQPEQAAKAGGASNVKQDASANSAPPNRAESGVYTSSALTDKRQSTYAKGDIVNLTA